MVKRLPFPTFFLTVPVVLRLNDAGLDENGAPQPAVEWRGRGWWSERAETAVNTDGRTVRLRGRLVLAGDVAPQLAVISDGEAEVAGACYRLWAARRPRNPDGSVHHTSLELM